MDLRHRSNHFILQSMVQSMVYKSPSFLLKTRLTSKFFFQNDNTNKLIGLIFYFWGTLKMDRYYNKYIYFTEFIKKWLHNYTTLINYCLAIFTSIPQRAYAGNLGDVVGSVPDHCNKANMAIKRATQIFWFPSAYKSYAYTIL